MKIMKTEEKESLVSRRSFFRSTAQVILPMLALTILSSCAPAKKLSDTPSTCNGSCYTICTVTCRNTCGTCSGMCSNTCSRSSKFMCATCSYQCYGGCEGTCAGTGQFSVKNSDSIKKDR